MIIYISIVISDHYLKTRQKIEYVNSKINILLISKDKIIENTLKNLFFENSKKVDMKYYATTF